MDTSKEYIKMCDCPEIQDQFFSSVPALMDQLPSYTYEKRLDRVCIAIWTPSSLRKRVKTHLLQPVVAVSIEQDRDQGKEVPPEDGPAGDSAIWLPRQDQLQEMITNFNIYTTTEDFSKWINTAFRSAVKWESLEQMWLGYLMKIYFSKFWTDGKWKKEK